VLNLPRRGSQDPLYLVVGGRRGGRQGGGVVGGRTGPSEGRRTRSEM